MSFRFGPKPPTASEVASGASLLKALVPRLGGALRVLRRVKLGIGRQLLLEALLHQLQIAIGGGNGVAGLL